MAFTLSPRLFTMAAQWAKTARTDIPVPPIPGVAYRNTGLPAPDIETGQAYDKVFDSARYNEMLHQVTGMALEAATYGLPRYSDLTNYEAGGWCLGPDGAFYQAIQASGPNVAGAGAQPVSNAVYWKRVPLDDLMSEAPTDGTLYGRQNGSWSPIDTGGGGEVPTGKFMPEPHNGDDGPGQVVILESGAEDFVTKLPQGGTWLAYYWKVYGWEEGAPWQDGIGEQKIGVYDGGFELTTGISSLAGFAWRIQ